MTTTTIIRTAQTAYEVGATYEEVIQVLQAGSIEGVTVTGNRFTTAAAQVTAIETITRRGVGFVAAEQRYIGEAVDEAFIELAEAEAAHCYQLAA
jgi:hypothetical protein